MKKLIITILLLTIGYNLHFAYEEYQHQQYLKELVKINQLEVLRCTMDNVDYCD